MQKGGMMLHDFILLCRSVLVSFMLLLTKDKSYIEIYLEKIHDCH